MSDATQAAPTQAAPQTPTEGKSNTPAQGTPQAAPPGQTPTGTQDPKAGAVSSAAQEAMRKYKVKVSGQELEVDEAELLRGYSHKQAASKEMQEAKRLRKQNEEFIAMMKDPQRLWEVAQKLGHDPRKVSEEFLARQIKRELADPRDVELEDLRAKLQSIEELDRQQKEMEKAQHHEAMKKKFAQEYSDQFVEVLKTSGLPPTKEMVGRMAFYIQRSAKLGYQITPQEASVLVKEDLQKFTGSLYGNTDGETLLKLLGDEVAAKILTARGAQVKDPNAGLHTPPNQTGGRERNREKSQRMSHKEWRKFNRE